MGLFILTHIQEDISQEKWEKIYNESLAMLNKFPVPLLRYSFEEIDGIERRSFTSDLVSHKNQEDEYWYIFGDAYSLNRAEDFRLYKNINQYRTETPRKYNSHILDSGDIPIYSDSLNGVPVFNGKTQGYPYHLAVLATAILIENRLPAGKSHLGGDINIAQCRHVVDWMNTVLDEKVKLPICCDFKRLYTSLLSIHSNKSDALNNCYYIYKGYKQEWIDLVVKYENKEVLIDFFANLLSKEKPNTLGASRIIDPLVQYVESPAELIALFEKTNKILESEKKDNEKNPKLFLIEDLLRHYISIFITFTQEEKEPLYVYTSDDYNLSTIGDVFSNLFMLLSGRPNFVDTYIPKEEILEIFTKYKPENKETFEKIIEKEEKDCREKIKQAQELIETLKKKGKEVAKEAKIETEQKEDPMLSEIKQTKTLNEHELYILEQTFKQKPVFQDPIKSAKALRKQIETVLKEQKNYGDDTFIEASAAELKKMIYRASYERFGITSKAWENIDNEQDIKILRTIAILTSLADDSLKFAKWREFFLENNYLWQYCTDNRLEA